MFITTIYNCCQVWITIFNTVYHMLQSIITQNSKFAKIWLKTFEKKVGSIEEEGEQESLMYST